jgi:hypothetical protein
MATNKTLRRFASASLGRFSFHSPFRHLAVPAPACACADVLP